ncbi:Oidioi.mRNA.OKI2018_I69.XSR.g16982.t1.cds [Oikopleura dioica]|uniref:Oidioi.mRNA.OKI2018_I69.XSR.g16982.t1.cds n=1 Tax=Oikopleura dioica TaxID=34765 RepID=A0ABN7SP41_OIKDI|nr:Oidioi.mRNA.OKI2018_I69.XSR.g16982.t1.cds [Oikopleura dioica]
MPIDQMIFELESDSLKNLSSPSRAQNFWTTKSTPTKTEDTGKEKEKRLLMTPTKNSSFDRTVERFYDEELTQEDLSRDCYMASLLKNLTCTQKKKKCPAMNLSENEVRSGRRLSFGNKRKGRSRAVFQTQEPRELESIQFIEEDDEDTPVPMKKSQTQ